MGCWSGWAGACGRCVCGGGGRVSGWVCACVHACVRPVMPPLHVLHVLVRQYCSWPPSHTQSPTPILPCVCPLNPLPPPMQGRVRRQRGACTHTPWLGLPGLMPAHTPHSAIANMGDGLSEAGDMPHAHPKALAVDDDASFTGIWRCVCWGGMGGGRLGLQLWA